VGTSGSGTPTVALVFGLDNAVVRWLTLRMRDEGIAAVSMPADLPPSAAQAICSAADAGVHVVSARSGMDGSFLEYWQLLAEAGKSRLVAVHDLLPTALDINETAAIASRVLEEDVLPATFPLLDDDESVVGVLDAITGQQSFPDGTTEPPRDDFTEAVAMETNSLFDEADAVGSTPQEALADGALAMAVTVDVRSGAGVSWLAARLPSRTEPAATTVLPADGNDAVVLTAGPDGLAVGPVLVVQATSTSSAHVTSMADLLVPGLKDRLEPGASASALMTPRPALGALLFQDQPG
jgi:hypothetical protein